MLLYAREVAFATAAVYARAAEARGAWDARLEALVVDAVVRSEADRPCSPARAPSAGAPTATWPWCWAPRLPTARSSTSSSLRRSARAVDMDALCATQGDRLVVLLGGVTDPLKAATRLLDHFGEGPVVVGPVTPTCPAGRLGACRALGSPRRRGWPDPPRRSKRRPPARARAGRGRPARATSSTRCTRRWRRPGGTLLETRAPSSRRRARSRARRARSSCTPTRSATGWARSPTSRLVTDPPARGLALRSRWSGPSSGRHADCRNPTKIRGVSFVRRRTRVADPRTRQMGPCSSSSPRPGLPDPRLPHPLARDPACAARLDWLSAVAGIDLAHYGTEADAETIRDTAIAQPLLVASGLVAALDLFPHPADASARRCGRRALGRRDHRRRRCRVISAEQAMVFVRERGNAMAEAAATTAPA